MEVNSCPGCANPKFKIVGGLGTQFDTPVGGLIFRQPEYRIRGFTNCGLYYKSHILNESELLQYYQVIDFSKWEIDGLFPSEQALIDVLSSLPEGSRILDYGCSSGRLLSNLVNRYKCFGVELNKKAAESAENKGIGILSEKEIQSGDDALFDAIVLCDVFEHLQEPTKILRMLCRSLRPEAILLVCTGNADAKACQKDIASFWYFRTPEHLCMLSRKYADHLALSFNLKLALWKEVSHYKTQLPERVRQHVKNFAFWQFNDKSSSIFTSLLTMIPVISKAKNWRLPPALTCTKDHVLIGFQN
jgi:2-polyprenyl-3-methyl-5-hydroxy-6-metoxy-1,4-benzoquinol methylase